MFFKYFRDLIFIYSFILKEGEGDNSANNTALNP